MFSTQWRNVIAGVVCFLVAASFVPAAATVPGTVSYQGFLRDQNGAPVDGTVSLSFKIYATQTGGAALWTEDHGAVAADEGVFQVLLGSITAFPPTLFAAPDRWLETIVEASPLIPRRPFAAVPFALRASVAEMALTAGDSVWEQASGNVYRAAGNVGIGTSDPARGLHVQDGELNLLPAALSNEDIVIESSDAVLGLFSNTAGTFGSGLGLSEVSGGAVSNSWALIRRTTGGGNSLDIRYNDGVATTPIMQMEPDGKIGIATETPTSKLSVAGDVDANQYAANLDLGGATTPEIGGLYRDNVIYAWGRINGDGTILDEFGVLSVTRLAAGSYDVRLDRSLAESAVVVTTLAANDPVLATAGSLSGNLFHVNTKLYVQPSGFIGSDYAFYFQVVGRP